MTTSEGFFLTRTGQADRAFELRPLSLPEPEARQVLIEVSAFGLNYADVMARNGLYADAPPMPCVLGYEVVGHITRVGSEVKDLEVGQRVVAFTRFGGYARHTMAAVEAVHPLPDSIPDGQGTALATQYCTAYYAAILRAALSPGDRVLIHAGAGGVGTALIQLARWKQCTVWASAGSEAKLEYLRAEGVDFPINYRTKDYVEEARRSLAGETLDVIFNPIGGKTYKQDRSLLSKGGGRHVLYGVSSMSGSRGSALDKLRLAWQFGLTHPLQFLIHSQSLIGVNMLRVADFRPQLIGQCLEQVVHLTQEGVLQPKVFEVFSHHRLAEAHTALENRSSTGKVAIRWD